MGQIGINAAFYRGGSSKAVVFKRSDLPTDRTLWDPLFLHILGSPDPYQRQLNGLGGGLSSLSKVVIVELSDHAEAELDYTFVQIAVDEPVADYGQMCGNMSASIAPFAIDEKLITRPDGPATVRIRNTNTDKVFEAQFEVKNGRSVEEGDFVIPGVAGTGAKISLNYLDPGGSASRGFLPTGATINELVIADIGSIEVSLVDATNPVVFVRAHDLGFSGSETPEILENDQNLLPLLDRIRREAGVLMGMADSANTVALSNPKIALVSKPSDFTALDGSQYNTGSHDITVRIVSMGRIHRAVTLTGAMCLGAAAQVPGTIPFEINSASKQLRIANPSGILPVNSDVSQISNGDYTVGSTTTYRTQRRMMEGRVLVPSKLMSLTC